MRIRLCLIFIIISSSCVQGQQKSSFKDFYKANFKECLAGVSSKQIFASVGATVENCTSFFDIDKYLLIASYLKAKKTK